MKRTIVLLLLVTVATVSSAQKCKFEKNEKDRFTGKTTVITKTQMIIGKITGFILKMNGKKVDQQMYIGIEIYLNTGVFMITPDDQVRILLSDESVIDLTPTETKISTRWGNTQYVIMDYGLSFENRERLMANLAKAIRINTSKGYQEKDLTEAQAEKIRQVLKCI